MILKLILKTSGLETFSVNNGWTAFIIFLFGDPHLLEGTEGGQDGATDPYRVFPLRRSNNLDLNGGWCQGSDFLLHSVSNTRIHGGATRHDSVGIQVLTDINITLHDGVVGGLMDTAGFHSQERWLEEGLRGTESLIANGDNLTVGKLIGLLQGGGGSSSGHFLLKVKGNIAKLLLDVTDNFTLSSSGERVTTLSEDLHEVVGEFTASQVQTENSMRKSITLIDGNIHSGHVEGLEHDLGHLFTIGLGVEGSFSQEDRLFLRGDTEFIVEGVMPDLLHVIPVGDNTVFNWIFEGKDTSLGLGFISNIGVFLTHTNH